MPRIKFKPENKVAYDKTPVCFKVKEGVRDELMKISGWQGKLREYVDRLIAGQTENNG